MMTRAELLESFRGHTCAHCRRGLAELKQLLVDAEAGGYTSIAIPDIALRWLVDYVEANMPEEVVRADAN